MHRGKVRQELGVGVWVGVGPRWHGAGEALAEGDYGRHGRPTTRNQESCSPHVFISERASNHRLHNRVLIFWNLNCTFNNLPLKPLVLPPEIIWIPNT